MVHDRGTVIGTGVSIDYGNPFDVMGGNGFGSGHTDPRFHFNARYKRNLDWLTDSNVQTLPSDGIYRIVAEDSAPSGGIRALKIRKNQAKNYLIEFRQLFTGNPCVMNGAVINWDDIISLGL